MKPANSSEHGVPTPDGERTELEDLNLGVDPTKSEADSGTLRGRLRRAFHNLNLVMAGMYTGLTCYGTPHERHSYGSNKQAGEKKPDNRPL